MTTLTPLAPLLARLFKEAEAATSPASFSRDERERCCAARPSMSTSTDG